MCTVKRAIFSVYYVVYIVQCAMFSCAVSNVEYEVWSEQCLLRSVQYPEYMVQCAVSIVLCIMCSKQWSVCSIKCVEAE